MEQFKKRLAALLAVKSVVTIILTLVLARSARINFSPCSRW